MKAPKQNGHSRSGRKGKKGLLQKATTLLELLITYALRARQHLWLIPQTSIRAARRMHLEKYLVQSTDTLLVHRKIWMGMRMC